MLILHRMEGTAIEVWNDQICIRIIVIEQKGKQVVIGVEAPKAFRIDRQEVA